MAYDRTVFLPIDHDAAFDLVTQPERLRRWCTVSARVDLRLGGELRWTITPANNALGKFTEIEPGRRLSFTFGWVNDPNLQPGASQVTITMEPVAGGTNLRLFHDGLTKEQDESHAEGWNYFLDRLIQFATTSQATADPWNASPDNLTPIKSADAALAIAQLVLYRVKDEQLLNSTPCSEFNLGQLIDHQYSALVSIAKSLGVSAPERPDATFEDRLAELSQIILETFQARGLEGNLTLGTHTLPANVVVNILNVELLIHAFDAAKASGQDFELSPALAEYQLEIARKTITPQGRESGLFGEEIVTKESDDAVTRLLAFTGRNR